MPLLLVLEFVLVFIVVEVVFLHDVQLYRIKSNYFKLGTTLLTGNTLAFIRIGINMNIRVTLGTGSSRHFFTSNKFI
ncbi:MAG: hypothetical protein QOD33_1211 [Pyrinomonadaceae bacterium]|nr:hypothetical protein [Pyrinomonadaceae bacterium]